MMSGSRLTLYGVAQKSRSPGLSASSSKLSSRCASTASKVPALRTPNVLLARTARHAFNSALREQIINKAWGVHSTAPQISRVDFVAKIFGRQVETEIDNLSNVWRVTFRTRYLGERNGRVGVGRTKSLLVSDRTIRPAPPSRALRQC